MVEDTQGTKDAELNTKKERSRHQLIQATIESIAQGGFADLTLARVSSQAEMSSGIVNLHFTNKETLLIETLQFLIDDYRQNWELALTQANNTPAEKLHALIAADFDASVCDRDKIGVWFAFLGEATTRPTYRNICEKNEDFYREVMSGIIQDLIDEGGYKNLDANQITEMIMAQCDGLWLTMLLSPTKITPSKTKETLLALLVMLFPNHFPR
jgi:TetR/AcrR family transcriptional repressor of bet genes